MFDKNASPAFKRHSIGIIIVGCLAMYFSCCLSTDALNVLQPIFTQIGWSYSQITMPLTIGGYILVALSFVFSTIIIKNGTRVFGTMAFAAMAVGTLLIAVAYMMNNYAFFMAGGLLSKFGAQASQMFIFQLCAEWFVTARGRILGIITMAAPLDSATSTTILTLLNKKIGFSATYIVLAVVLGIATVLAFLFSQTRPSDMGMLPDGIARKAETEKGEEQTAVLTMKQILSSVSTWKLIIAFGIFNGTISAIMSFHITRMTEVNVNSALALGLLSVAAIIGLPFGYIYGWLDDKFNTIVACTVLGISYIILCTALLFGSANNMWLIFVAVVGMGSMTGGCPNRHPASIMYTFGTSEYQNANRYIGIGISLISAFGPQLMSACMDKTGSLNLGYGIFAVLCAIATLCIATTKKVEVK